VTQEPTAVDHWADDKLGRREDALFIIDFLTSRIAERGELGRAKSYVLNLNAEWGFGKSFFLDRLAKELEQQKRLVAQVNAWRSDHADDPLIPIMAAIDEVLRPHMTERSAQTKLRKVTRTGVAVALAAAKGAAVHWTKKAIGDGLEDAMEQFSLATDEKAKAAVEDAAGKEISGTLDERARLLLKSFETAERSISQFRTQLKELLEGLSSEQLPLFLLVDELDRCRPPYAISLLERVKHLFEIDNVVFIIATDTRQLRHSIGAVYGVGFESERYLKRFFDRTYEFVRPSLKDFVAALCISAPIDERKTDVLPGISIASFITQFSELFELGLRDIEQTYDLVRTVVSIWKPTSRVQLAFLFPLAVAAHKGIENDDMLDVWETHNSASPWIVSMHRPNGDLVYVNVSEVFRALHSASRTPLKDLYKTNPTDQPTLFAALAVDAEMRHASAKHSLLRSYPSLVRMAGRLSAP
jgi:hypothetical protein